VQIQKRELYITAVQTCRLQHRNSVRKLLSLQYKTRVVFQSLRAIEWSSGHCLLCSFSLGETRVVELRRWWHTLCYKTAENNMTAVVLRKHVNYLLITVSCKYATARGHRREASVNCSLMERTVNLSDIFWCNETCKNEIGLDCNSLYCQLVTNKNITAQRGVVQPRLTIIHINITRKQCLTASRRLMFDTLITQQHVVW